MVTAKGKTLSLSGWAKELGISKQRVHQLYKDGRLLQYIDGKRLSRGRHPISEEERIEAEEKLLLFLDEPKTVDEIAAFLGVSKARCYALLRNIKDRIERNVEYRTRIR